MNTIFPLQIKKSPKWKVSKLHIELPYTHEELLSEFENEEWQNPSILNNLGNDNWNNVRFKCMRPKEQHKRLRELHQFFSSNELKSKLVHWLYENDESMWSDWEWTPEELCRHTNLHGEFSKDLPGFVNVLHTDFRKLVATGLVYYAKEDNPDLSTVFYDTVDRANPVRMTTNFGDGWVHSNGNNTWHEGWNRTNQNRYSTLLALTLNINPIQNKVR
jgi:hypothetical protein